MTWDELLKDINDFFINLTRDKIFKHEKDDFLNHVKESLKLNKKEDWNYILASEDLLDDSNEAISSFLRFGVSGPTKYNDLGEKYLRLYGVLNATYLQQQAVLNLYKFFQCHSVKAKNNQFNELEVVTLRHKLAAHSANYDDRKSNEMHVFVPVRMELNDFECSYFNHSTDESRTVDLKLMIESHLELMCSTYVDIVKKTISTIYKHDKGEQNTLLEKIMPFEEMLAGNSLVKNQTTGEYIIISYG